MILNMCKICSSIEIVIPYDWKKIVNHVKSLIIIIPQIDFLKAITISMW